MNLDKKMSKNTVVSVIEEKLQGDIGREWTNEVNRTGSINKDDEKFPTV